VLPPERVIRMLSQVAMGLDASHAINFVHRDLKPDNLFLCGTREGDVVRILDFGSVKDKNTDAKKLTVMGTTIGSPFYMAPEQAQGLDTLDARADVFALAAITYECITGRVPFEGNNGPSILLAILTKDPEPPTVKGKAAPFPIPPALDDVMEEALAKNPAIRTKSVGLLADAVGHAYGLAGDHIAWAKTPQQELQKQIQAAMATTMQARPQAPPVFEAAADPFAAPPQQQHQLQQPITQQPISQQPQFNQYQHPQQAQHAYGANGPVQFAQNPNAPMTQEAPQMIPGLAPRAPWVLPVLVGGAALFIGGLLALVLTR
jgi:serine/threonine protein kinase